MIIKILLLLCFGLVGALALIAFAAGALFVHGFICHVSLTIFDSVVKAFQ